MPEDAKSTQRPGGKILLIILLFLLVAGGGFLIGRYVIADNFNQEGSLVSTVKDEPKNIVPAQIKSNVNVTVQGSVQNYQITMPSGSTVLQAMENIKPEQGFTFTAKNSAGGKMIESINGLNNDAKNFWLYEVNGKSATVGAEEYVLQNGDEVNWTFTAL